MSRTYRKVPHWTSKKTLQHDFADDFNIFRRKGREFNNADAYVKAAMVYFHGERPRAWQGMKNRVGPNGNVIGWDDEAPKDKSSRRYTNRIRRLMDKDEIKEALLDMVQSADEAYQEMMDMDDEYVNPCYDDWDDYKEDYLEMDDPYHLDDFYFDSWDDYDLY